MAAVERPLAPLNPLHYNDQREMIAHQLIPMDQALDGVFWCVVCGGHPDDPIHAGIHPLKENTMTLQTQDETKGMAWWNDLSVDQRKKWMGRAGNTGVAADAWAAFKNAEITPIPEDFQGPLSELSDWQAGTDKPATEGTYLREFEEGEATSTWSGGKWLRDGFFPSDVQDAPWRGIAV